jgi:hypothetical protein
VCQEKSPEFEHEAAEEKKEAKDDDEGDLDWTLIVDPQLDLYAPWLREVDKREGLSDAFQNEDISNIPGNLHLLVQPQSPHLLKSARVRDARLHQLGQTSVRGNGRSIKHRQSGPLHASITMLSDHPADRSGERTQGYGEPPQK